MKKLKAEEAALRRLLVVRKEKLAAAQFRLKRKLEDAERHKRTVIEHCDRVQEQRGAVCQRVGSLTQDGQRIKLGIQQLKDTAEREKLKARVSAGDRGQWHGLSLGSLIPAATH